MKKIWIIPVTVTFVLTMTGCNKFDGDSEYTYPKISSVEEKTGTSIKRTEYEWSDKGDLASERQLLNGSLVYEDADFEKDNTKQTFTRYRTYYDGGNVASRQKRVEYYGYNFMLMHKLEVFLLGAGGSETEPVEYWNTDYEVYGNGVRIKGYQEGDENAVTIKEGYKYEGNTMTYTKITTPKDGGIPSAPLTVTTTYLESAKDDNYISTIVTKTGNGKIVEFTKYTYSDSSLGGYETYAGTDIKVSSSNTVTDGTLIEKLSNYKFANYEESYDITIYDPDGTNGVVTSFKKIYKDITIRY